MDYKIAIRNREYTEWTCFDSMKLSEVEIPFEFSPSREKLFNQDMFDINEETKEIMVKHSSTRSMKGIPGVLLISKKRAFGKYKGKKNLYQCVPDDKRLPIFLVPYEIKNVGFSKKITNKYVVMQFDSWSDDQKHPIAKLQNTIGDVCHLENFYEYQLYCKSLYASIQGFTRDTTRALKKKSEAEFIEQLCDKYNVIKRFLDTDKIYTIDSKSCKDYDDAFSIKNVSLDERELTCISIYISNVSFWMEELELWNSFSERISSIYLPDKKRPMLPTVLSECLCSLVEKEKRFAFTMDIYVDLEELEFIDIKYLNTCIIVEKNLRYDTQELEENTEYRKLYDAITLLNRKKKYKYIDSITTSHDIIAYLMILMNYQCAKKMVEHKCGLFRSVTAIHRDIPEHLPQDVNKFLTYWGSSGGVYEKYNDETAMKKHEILRFDSYVHITSPIRRLADLLNIIQLQTKLRLTDLTKSAEDFYDYWTGDEKLDYVNRTMRVIRKVQCACNLLDLCTNHPETLEKEYTGYVFDRIKRNDGLYQYVAFICEIKMVSRYVSRHELDNFTEKKFKLFLFHDEDSLKRKVRVNMID